MYTVDYDKSVYVKNDAGKVWASISHTTQGGKLFTLGIKPVAGVEHIMQLDRDEVEALSDMFGEILGSSNG